MRLIQRLHESQDALRILNHHHPEWGTLSIAHLFKAIGYQRVGVYACAAREFGYAAAAAEKEGRENPRGTLPFWYEIQDGEY